MNASNGMDNFTAVVGRVMAVEETMLGGPTQPFFFRARGRLTVDSQAAFDRLAEAAKPLGLTPILRQADGRQEILLVRNPVRPGGPGARVNLILFLLTLASVILTAAVNSIPASAIPCETPTELAGTLQYQLKVIWIVVQQGIANFPAGLPFALSFLAVLGAHEFGHYLAGLRNKARVTLPFFIPLPLVSPFGTLGAVISMQEPPKNRNVLAEIGIAGPLAGFIVALPLLVIGLALSTVEALPTALGPCEGFSLEGNSILYLLAKLAVFGRILPAPAHFDVAPVVFYLRAFFTGFPFPLEGADVIIHPVAFGAWAGLMITGLNLIPAGQLDGGHLLYVLLGERARRWLPGILAGLVALGFFWPGWFLMAVLVFFFGRTHAEPLDTVTPLSPGHRRLALLGLVLFLLLFTPIPLQVFGA
jgi:hypothetical protein